ncbi:unnamed protein product [Phytophthora fragariaefolia]|uniref:Unnamed protein product n=1 Tax=Phytophthora fragariaefolia TaxID=1490495 RepID=A0A9W6Y6J5_9STRA|nr:unnamed protein product [Phytophthora fragariaefolia]
MEETLSTLRFGSRAKNIQNSPHINNASIGAAAEYTELLMMLQNKIENLRSYIRQLENSRCQACKSRGSLLDNNLTLYPETANVDTTATTDQEPVRIPTGPAENPAIDKDDFDSITDDIMQAEIQSLRRALACMMRDHEVQESTRHAVQTLMEVTEQQLDLRHTTQEKIIQRQTLELQDALATIARLEKKMEPLEESYRGMNFELNLLRAQQHQHQVSENAEAEILRRQLDASIKQVKNLQATLSDSRQNQGCVADLKERLMTKECELKSLRSEMEVLRSKKQPPTVPNIATVGLPSPHRVPQMRPATTVDFKAFPITTSSTASWGDSKHGITNIQSWWAGIGDDTPIRNQDDTATLPANYSCREHVLPLSPGSLHGEGCVSLNNGQSEVLRTDNAMSRVCNSASSTTRPFRARLVGLLNSLEEETTAYKELVVDTKERTQSRNASRPRRQLPSLEIISSTMPSPSPLN